MPKLRRTRTIRVASFSFRRRAPNALCLSLGAGQEGKRVLTMTLCGQITDQLKSPFSSGLSLPQICDARIAGVYLQIESLNCGWGKVEEIRRHIYIGLPEISEKEYYLASACQEIYAPPSAYFSLFGLSVQASFVRGVLEKIGVEPQVERIGKCKSAVEQFASPTMSEENCEMLTALLDNIYGKLLDIISSTRENREKILRSLLMKECTK